MEDKIQELENRIKYLEDRMISTDERIETHRQYAREDHTRFLDFVMAVSKNVNSVRFALFLAFFAIGCHLLTHHISSWGK